MMEYPSRSNLNCFLSFNEASAKGGELFGPTVIVDITLVRETIIFCCPGRGRTSKFFVQSEVTLPFVYRTILISPICQRTLF